MKPTLMVLLTSCLCLSVVGTEREQLLELKIKAASGDAQACESLVIMFQSKKGSPQDHAEALIIYKKLAKENHAGAQQALGLMFREGYGVKIDYKEAFKWAQKAANQGNIGACNDLGYAYCSALGVERNHELAMRWFLKAVELGNGYYTPYMIGLLYKNGEGVEKNAVTALAWFNTTSISWGKDEKSKLVKEMTKAQIAEADKLSKELLKKIGSKKKAKKN